MIVQVNCKKSSFVICTFSYKNDILKNIIYHVPQFVIQNAKLQKHNTNADTKDRPHIWGWGVGFNWLHQTGRFLSDISGIMKKSPAVQRWLKSL